MRTPHNPRFARVLGQLTIGVALTFGVTQAQVQPVAPTAPGAAVVPQPSRPPIGSVTPVERPPDPVGVKRVFAIGTATVFNGNIGSARQAALQAAYAEAIALGAGTEIGRMTLIRNVRAVTDIVSSRSRGFIRSYEVVRDEFVAGPPARYELRISAEVVVSSAGPAEELEGLKLFLDVIGSPKLLILLPERDVTTRPAVASSGESTQITVRAGTTAVSVNAGSPAEAAAPGGPGFQEPEGVMRGAEAALAAAFAKFGYLVSTSDDLVAGGFASAEQLSRARRGVTADAMAVARAAGADLLLTGVLRTATQRVTPQDVEFISATTEASAKAMVVSNGYLIDAFHKTVTRAHVSALGAVSMSLEAIAADLASTLAWRIPSILAARPRVTRLVVANVNLATADRIKTSLEQVEGVDVVRFASVPTTGRRTAEFELLSGFVAIPHDELINYCIETAGPVQVREADKFTVSLSVL